MMARPAGRARRNPAKSEPTEIELVDRNIDPPNRVVVTDPIFKPIRKHRS